jgi:putative hydrolase of the HAD superfamily
VSGPSLRHQAQTLLFDADDTLWENNVYFERAIAAFTSYLDHSTHTPEEVREHLNRCERATIAEHGYGLKSFQRSLVDCFEQLSHVPITPERHQRIVSFAESISTQEMELIANAEATLRELRGRHQLVMVTKGVPEEQIDKLERSGLRDLFSDVEVLLEKNTAAYQKLIARHGWHSPTTWMIGNSPKSDINPALEAGLNAVFLPHDCTWVLEHEELAEATPPARLLQLRGIANLLEYF